MDWHTLIADLQAAGMTQAMIGAALGKSQAWVGDIVRGRYDDLKWADGQALRRLHESAMRPVATKEAPAKRRISAVDYP